MRSFLSYVKFVFSLSLGLFVACAALPSLNVTYKSMPKSDVLEGREIYFRFIDKRSDKDIIGKGAEDLFRKYGFKIVT